MASLGEQVREQREIAGRALTICKHLRKENDRLRKERDDARNDVERLLEKLRNIIEGKTL